MAVCKHQQFPGNTFDGKTAVANNSGQTVYLDEHGIRSTKFLCSICWQRSASLVLAGIKRHGCVFDHFEEDFSASNHRGPPSLSRYRCNQPFFSHPPF